MRAANEPVAVPKEVIHRSEPYRRFVASQECFGCAIHGWSQCAHDNYDKGMGLKVCDTRTFPLCAPRFGLLGCHQQFDLCIDMTRDERRELGAQYVERMQLLAVAAGWMNEQRELIR